MKQEFLNGDLFLLNGSISCQYATENYTFCTRSTASSLCSFELAGNCYFGISTPINIYLGKPKIYQRNKITDTRTNLRANSGQLMFVDKGKLKPFSQITDGVHELRLIDNNNNIKWRTRIGILSDNFSISFKPNKNSALTGEIHLTACNQHNVTVTVDNCSANVIKENSLTIIKLQANNAIPNSIKINILPQGCKREITLTVPFPASGALLYNPNGNLLKGIQTLDFKELYGYRLKAFKNNDTKEIQFICRLIDDKASNQDTRGIYIEKKINLAESITEFSLIDWQQEITNLLSVSAGLDSYVQLTLSMYGSNDIKINFYRYEADLEKLDNYHVGITNEQLKTFDINKLQKTKLQALYLNDIKQKKVELTATQSEGRRHFQWKLAIAN